MAPSPGQEKVETWRTENRGPGAPHWSLVTNNKYLESGIRDTLWSHAQAEGVNTPDMRHGLTLPRQLDSFSSLLVTFKVLKVSFIAV